MSCVPVLTTKDDLERLYNKKKLTTYEIADIYNCCHATIWKKLKGYRIKCLPNGRRSLIIPKSKLRYLYISQRLSSRKIAKLYGCAYSAIDYKIKKQGFPIRKRAESHIIYPRRNFDGDKKDKAYLIGFAMGDLRVRRQYPNSETIHVDCGSTKTEQINLIKKLFSRYGRVWVSKPNKKNAVQVECFLNNSFKFLLKKRKIIDNWILNNKKYFLSFLAGFTDAEGCISAYRGLDYYALGNYNKGILIQIRNFLIKNKIVVPKLYESKIKGTICFKKYFHNQNYWQLRVMRKTSLLNLFRLMGQYMKHYDKIKSMKSAIKNIDKRNKKFGHLKMN